MIKTLILLISVPASAALPCGEWGQDATQQAACDVLKKHGLDGRSAPGYKMLEVLFAESSAPTPKSLKGWRVGRRFMRGSPGKYLPAQAVLQGTLAVEGDGGPLTGDLFKMRLFFDYSPEQADAVTRERIKSHKDDSMGWRAVSLPEYSDREMSYQSVWDSESGAEEKTYRVRQFGSWVIVQYADVHRFGGVDRSYYGYFYKDVTPLSFPAKTTVLKAIERWAALSREGSSDWRYNRFFSGLVTMGAHDAARAGDRLAEGAIKNKLMSGWHVTVFFPERLSTEEQRAAATKAVSEGRTPYQGSSGGWLEKEWTTQTGDKALIGEISELTAEPRETAGFVYSYEGALPPLTMRSEPTLTLLTREDVTDMSSGIFRWASKKIKIRLAAAESSDSDYKPALP